MRSVIMMIVATLALASALRLPQLQVSSVPLALSPKAMRCRVAQPLMAADEPADKAAASPAVEASAEPEVPAPPPAVDFTPSVPATKKPDIKETLLDPTNYSISLSLLAVFLVVKALSYFGVIDLAD